MKNPSICFALLWLLGMGGAQAQGEAQGLQATIWRGSYDCAQGATPATLIIKTSVPDGARQHVDASFHFGGGAVPRGSYLLEGSYDPATGELSLTPTRWVGRPGNYVAVGFQGRVDERLAAFDGKVDFHLCGAIRLTNQTPRPQDLIARIAPAQATPDPSPPPPQARPFAANFELAFGAAPGYPGCTVQLIPKGEPCFNHAVAIGTDRPWSPASEGSYVIDRVRMTFLARTMLGDFPNSKRGPHVTVTLKAGQLTSIAMSRLPWETDVKKLLDGLTRTYGASRQTVERRASPGKPGERMDVTTYTWTASDSIVRFECYAVCDLTAMAAP